MEENEESYAYLQGFFARSRKRFTIVGDNNGKYKITKVSSDEDKKKTSDLAKVFSDFSQNDDEDHKIKELALHFGLDDSVPQEQLFYKVVERLSADKVVGNILKTPINTDDLAKHLFGTVSYSDDALRGLLIILSGSKKDGKAPLPLRFHYFFRNFQGLWACSNPDCSEIDTKGTEARRPIGKLFTKPTLTCGCGGRVLDLLFCEVCGEIFLGGFKAEYSNEDIGFYLVHDQPKLENAPDKVPLDNDYREYRLFWPSKEEPEERDWSYDKTKWSWKRAKFDHESGKIRTHGRGPQKLSNCWLYAMNGRATNSNKRLPAFPSLCPRCGTNWNRKKRSPIAKQRAGFQKSCQVVVDAMMREMSSVSRKMVLFTDSRQDAAKLSAGIEIDHYKDALRQLLVDRFDHYIERSDAFLEMIKTNKTTELAKEFKSIFPEEAAAILLDIRECGDEDDKKAHNRIQQEIKNRAIPLDKISRDIAQEMLSIGTNPGGWHNKINSYQNGGKEESWKNLVKWVEIPWFKSILNDEQKECKKDIIYYLKKECVYIMFAHMKRSYEDLRLGWITFDITQSFQDKQYYDIARQAADGVIRILGERRRYIGSDNDYPATTFPKPARDYLDKITSKACLNNRHIIQ